MLSDDDLARLLEAARGAAARAYAPYSGFRVGAAVLSGRGEVFAGCNVENASYGLTICAERNAVFGLVASGEAPPTVLAVLIYTPTPTPTAPCGACRQVLNEFGPGCEVVSACDGPERLRTTLDRLLPDAFGPRNLA
ncbi:cytidine deaminase [Paludisphaera soli]|uniref:cytidine deaminase n=1 Tax=Paludisphaera soli TaxID=2712865 RepID=UPI0013E9CFD5|nr:cytidine deaminase [Paludisphaera soli]